MSQQVVHTKLVDKVLLLLNSHNFPHLRTSLGRIDIDIGKLGELGYDMIIGRDLLQALKMTIYFEYQV